MVKTKETNKSKKISPRKKAALEILHHRLGQKSTISLMSVDTTNVWQDIELSICQDPFFTSCRISSINKKARSKDPLKPKAPSKWISWILFHQHHQNI